jgi:hypothetical protein
VEAGPAASDRKPSDDPVAPRRPVTRRPGWRPRGWSEVAVRGVRARHNNGEHRQERACRISRGHRDYGGGAASRAQREPRSGNGQSMHRRQMKRRSRVRGRQTNTLRQERASPSSALAWSLRSAFVRTLDRLGNARLGPRLQSNGQTGKILFSRLASNAIRRSTKSSFEKRRKSSPALLQDCSKADPKFRQRPCSSDVE